MVYGFNIKEWRKFFPQMITETNKVYKERCYRQNINLVISELEAAKYDDIQEIIQEFDNKKNTCTWTITIKRRI